ncbi:FCS-Like Zinc finger 5-like [Nicotiana tomentosiformis]|uniref:FCS-Like Zinc finger 5-like n=1 Tax=Nicotiana tomentosiformis TaxID=4098 RepID=UPI00051BEA1B|nr:FCS-Like Zinc finger 5-like isoform X1 [Nicotiana tomentosiformis]
MMLGKRGRPPMRRTTSMTGITVDIGTGTGSEQEPSDYRPKVIVDHHDQFKGSSEKQVMMSSTTAGGYDHQYFMAAMVSPRYQRRISGEGFQTETANFLRTCGLCNRRLAPGRDIYMYRGDIAFCSMECREQQMKQDERKEKSNKLNSNKTENHHNHSEFPSANSETSSKSETIAAA